MAVLPIPLSSWFVAILLKPHTALRRLTRFPKKMNGEAILLRSPSRTIAYGLRWRVLYETL